MSNVFVQSKAAMSFGTAALAVTFDSDIIAGNLICGFVGIESATETIDGVADSRSNSYALLDNPTTGEDSRAALFYAKNIAGGACTVTVTLSASEVCYIVVHEISGADVDSPLDQHGINVQDDSGIGTDAVTSGSKVTTAAGEYVFGATYTYARTSAAAGTGFTERATASGIYSEGLVQAGAGAIAATFTNSNAFEDNLTGILTFKESGGTPPLAGIGSVGMIGYRRLRNYWRL